MSKERPVSEKVKNYRNNREGLYLKKQKSQGRSFEEIRLSDLEEVDKSFKRGLIKEYGFLQALRLRLFYFLSAGIKEVNSLYEKAHKDFFKQRADMMATEISANMSKKREVVVEKVLHLPVAEETDND